MSALLNQYFERYAEEAITKMKAALIAVDYYERIRLRLVKKEDLSGELAIIAKVGPAGTMAVVKEAIADYKKSKGEFVYPDANSTLRVSYGRIQSMDPRDGIHRPVRLSGRWVAQATVFLENRQMGGRVGFFVVTPLRLQGSGVNAVLNDVGGTFLAFNSIDLQDGSGSSGAFTKKTTCNSFFLLFFGC